MRNIKYLAFITSVDLGSFSKAAKVLGYTQSGLTHLMNRFEDEIGFNLIERGFYGIRPTEKGKQLLPIFRELVKNEEVLYNKITDLKNQDKTVIKIGAYSSMAQSWLPAIVQKFNKDFPDVIVKIQTGTVPSLYEGLENNLFDIIFASKNNKYSTNFIPLKTDEMLVVLPKDYFSGSEKETFDILELSNKKFLMPGLGFNIDILKAFKDYNVTPKIEETYLDDMAIISMVEHGLGVSMLSKLILKGNKNNVLALPFSPTIERQLGIAYNKNKELLEPIKTFILYAKEFANNYEI